jgi:hypothetical protein
MKHFILALMMTSCAGSFELARSSRTPAPTPRAAREVSALTAQSGFVDCVALDKKRRWELIAAQSGAALSGVGGLSTIPVKDDTVRAVVLIGSGVIAAVSLVVAKFADDDGAVWARECGQ